MSETTQALPSEDTPQITPESAVKWADYKREKQLEILRLEYDEAAHSKMLADLKAEAKRGIETQAEALPKEDKSLSTIEKRDMAAQEVLNANPAYVRIGRQIADLKDKIAFAKIERDHASDMLKIHLEFAYWGGESLTLSPTVIDELVGATPAGKDAVRS